MGALMQFRGNTSKPVQFVDPICGSSSQRYFRLRKLLAQGPREVSNSSLLDLQGAFSTNSITTGLSRVLFLC